MDFQEDYKISWHKIYKTENFEMQKFHDFLTFHKNNQH